MQPSSARQGPPAGAFRFVDIPRAVRYFLAEDRLGYLVFLGFFTLCMAFELAPPYLFGTISDILIGWKPGDGWGVLVALTAGLSISLAAVAVLRLYSKRVIGRTGINTRYRAKVWGFARLVDFSLAWHQTENTGNKAQRIITGAEAIRDFSAEFIPQAVRVAVTFSGALAACLFLSPWFALFFAAYLGVLLSVELWFDRLISRLSDQSNQSLENAAGAFVESAANILSVKALGAGGGMTAIVGERERSARDFAHRRIRVGTTKWMFLQLHNSLALGLYILLLARLVMAGGLAPGYVLTYIMYFMNLRQQATEFADRIQAMIERKSNLGRMMPYFWQDHALERGVQAFPAAWDAVAIRGGLFRYKDDAALAGLDLEIPRGAKIGVVGRSGSGKSTLVKLLLGLYKLEAGEIRVGPTRLDDIGRDELAANVAVVLQETELFNLSLRDNICLMREVDPALFARALQIACLDELVGRLAGGLDAPVGERGYSLSGGERQRLGIARAVCRDAPILLLDEATSALDGATEEKVMAGLLGDYARGRTLLIVAHRTATLARCDEILVFEAGRVVERGGYAELRADPASRFGAMRTMQAGA
jgi:ABC-type multidrug transport system fused ATPase/permease subunit